MYSLEQCNGKAEGMSEEEYEEDYAIITTQLAYTYQLQGKIEKAKALALIRGGLDAGLSIGQHVVEHTRGNAHGGLIVDVVNKLEEAGDTLTRQGGDKDDGGVGHEAQIAADLVPHVIHGLIVLLDGVPLIHHDDGGFACLVGELISSILSFFPASLSYTGNIT